MEVVGAETVSATGRRMSDGITDAVVTDADSVGVPCKASTGRSNCAHARRRSCLSHRPARLGTDIGVQIKASRSNEDVSGNCCPTRTAVLQTSSVNLLGIFIVAQA